MGEYQEKCYPSGNNSFLKIGIMSYAPKMLIHTDEKAKSIIKIGKYCSIAESVNFFPNAEHDIERISTYPFIGCSSVWTELVDMQGHPMTRGDIVIGHDVWVGFGSMIRSGVTVGNGAVVGMGSVVVKDIPPYAIATGNPAKIIRYRFSPEVIQRLNSIKWWDWPINIIRKHARLLNSPMNDNTLKQLEVIADSFSVNAHIQQETRNTMNEIKSESSLNTFDPQIEPWRFLDPGQNNHLGALNPNYAPRGLIDLLDTPPTLAVDIGCFIGATGAYMKQKWPQCRVVGVEPVAEAAAQARTKVDAVFEGFFEDMPVGEAGVEPGKVDLAVFADVLEHMRHPWGALRHIRDWLSPNGAVLVSLPNIRNLNVLKDLVGNGTFNYKPAGILDITHIRFFTRSDALKMFDQTGYTVEKMGINMDHSLINLLQQIPREGKFSFDVGSKMRLNDVDYAESEELCALQFWFLLRAKR